MKKIFNDKVKGAFLSFRQKAFVARVALVCFFGISFSFVFETVLDSFIAMPLRVHPSFVGGEVVSENVFDFGVYTVHKPVTNAKWQRSAEYWQLDLSFTDASASKNVELYIGFDNIEGGSDGLDKNFPWNFDVKICGDQGKVYDSQKNYVCDAECLLIDGGSQLKVRLPLRDKGLQKILGAKKTWHYVLVGDNSAAGSLVGPIQVEMAVQKGDKAKKLEQELLIVKQAKELYEQSAAQNDSDFDDVEKALDFYAQKLKEDPEDYVSMACYGSWLATKGGESSAMKAMSLVNQAYKYLDKAAEMSLGSVGELDVLMNRASVSAAVPEQVFGKAQTGAQDFMRAASLADDKNLKAYCFAMAYECFKKCGKDTQAAIALQEAKKMLR